MECKAVVVKQLSRVNEFMIKLYWIQITKCEDASKEINGQIISSKRMALDSY